MRREFDREPSGRSELHGRGSSLSAGRIPYIAGAAFLCLLGSCEQDVCRYPGSRPCVCDDGSEGSRSCFPTNDGYGPCVCGDGGISGLDGGEGVDGGADGAPGDGAILPDGESTNFCTALVDGSHCDGADLVGCQAGEVIARETCSRGCDSSATAGSQACLGPDASFCVGKQDGLWCDGEELVRCSGGAVVSWETCAAGCESMPLGTNDRCYSVPFCVAVPSPEEASAPQSACNYMDWHLSEDGFYLISQFGTSNDSTTWGHGTTCGYLQGHYDYHDCRYDVHAALCLDQNYAIPHVQGHVDYDYQTVLDLVDQYAPQDVPAPEYFYVADAQRFNCGALLRVSNPSNGRCVVVYTEDGGPGATYEGPTYGGRRILDSSPAVVRFLAVAHLGWANSDLVYVEWGQAGDLPGHACTPCQSSPAMAGAEASRTPWDPNHMMSGLDCR
ncbi:MAG: hypothetical protein RBU30_09000 [Polyangia bacterium]|nr:hypothetical protein [Polyangia bacterium]